MTAGQREHAELRARFVRDLREHGHATGELGALRVHLLKLHSRSWWTVEDTRALRPPLTSGEARDVEEACSDAVAAVVALLAGEPVPVLRPR